MYIFNTCGMCKRKFAEKYLFCALYFKFAFFFVEGNVEFCQSVFSPLTKEGVNCSLVCNLKFLNALSDENSTESALCIKNTSIAVPCKSNADCPRHIGSYCKGIPCFCKVRQGSSESYVIDPYSKIPIMYACIVRTKHLNPDLPIVPFPWRTLLIVIGLVFMCATCLVCGRWLTPILKSLKTKRTARGNQEQPAQVPEDNTSLFPSSTQQNTSTPFTYYFPRGVPHIYRANPRCSQHSHRSARARYAACAQAERSNTLSNQDKPPPYETAIQLPPPAYEDVERAILESNTDNDFVDIGRVIIHPAPSNTVPRCAPRS